MVAINIGNIYKRRMTKVTSIIRLYLPFDIVSFYMYVNICTCVRKKS